MGGQAGELKEGMAADVTLWDLTSLSLLPRTDPLSLLVLGSRTQSTGAGAALESCWTRGVRVVAAGEPCGVDVPALRSILRAAQPDFRDPEDTDPKTSPITAASEVEYRAAMGLDLAACGDCESSRHAATPNNLASYPQGRALYDATIP